MSTEQTVVENTEQSDARRFIPRAVGGMAVCLSGLYFLMSETMSEELWQDSAPTKAAKVIVGTTAMVAGWRTAPES